MRLRGFGLGWLVILGALASAASFTTGPAQALAPWFTCFNDSQAEASSLLLPSPLNEATVLEGTPVTFSGESPYALTFSVASSPALLSNPDIDSGPGSLQLGTSLYTFTSTKVSTAPRTIYWAASFTFTPPGCESSSTIMTPAHTLTVIPPPPPHEEPPATGEISLEGIAIDIQSTHTAAIRLACVGTATCSGKLTLTTKNTTGKPKQKHSRTETIGTTTFSIEASKQAPVTLTLNKRGRVLLNTAHGHLDAALTIFKTSPLPSETQKHSVRLEQHG
jgi:hypothetical protein